MLDIFEYGIIFYLLGALLFLCFIIWVIVKLILRLVRGKKDQKAIGSKNWYLQISLSREDALSQIYFVLALGFLAATIVTLNRSMNELLSWSALVLVCSVIGFVASYYYKLLYTLAFSLIGIIVWWVAKTGEWVMDKNLQPSSTLVVFGLLALLSIVVGTLHEFKPQFKRAATAYEGLGILLLAGMLFLLSSNSGLEMFEELLTGKPFYGSWQVSISLLVLVLALASGLYYGFTKKLIYAQEVITITLLSSLLLVIVFLPALSIYDNGNGYYYSYSSSTLTSTGAIWAVVFNIITLLGLLSVMLAGNLRRETWQINLAAILLFIFLFVKYFDWFYTFLDKSAFFIVAGVLFFGVGYVMERGRKKIIQNINAPTV